MPTAVPAFPCRRTTIIAAVEAYNRANPKAKLPRSAARLLAFMFAEQDVCGVTQQVLRDEGFGKELSKLFGALVAAGFVSRQATTEPTLRRGTPPHTYRLHLPAEVDAR